MNVKTCSKCNKEKLLTLFPKSGKGRFRAECKICHSEKNRAYHAKNTADIAKRKKEYYKKNIERYRKYQNKKTRTNPLFKLARICRGRVHAALKSKNFKKINRTVEMLGCNIPQLKAHIENQFKPGMSWELVGKFIHIDHIVPLASAKTQEEVEKLCHYTNLQPLWATENLKKGAKLTSI